MQTNMGPIDRGARLVVGVLLIAFALGFVLPNTGWNWLGWIGVVPILTALLGNCPAYSLLGVSTCPVKRA